MKLPFPKWTLNTNVEVYVSELNDYGKPIKNSAYVGKANFIDKSKQVLNANRELVLLSGTIIIPGDILSNYERDQTFYVSINGIEKRVFSINKPHNPDGSIFSTELLLT